MNTQYKPGALKADSFVGGVYLRVPVRAGSVVVGELTRRPRTGWHDGPANAYQFLPNEEGRGLGLSAVSGETTIRATLARASQQQEKSHE